MSDFPYIDHTLHVVKEAVLKLGFTEDIFHLIKQPAYDYRYYISVKMDDGSYKVFQGFRLQHSAAMSANMGMLRFQQTFDEEELHLATLWQAILCGLIDIPFGGAVGGIVCDPRSLTRSEIEVVSRKYIEACFPAISDGRNVISGNMLTHSQIIGLMFDEYSKLDGKNPYQSFAGKPYALGGFEQAEEMYALSVVCCINEALQIRGESIDELRVIVQGFGQLGSYIAKFLFDRGAKIVGLSDVYGALYDEQGLDIDYLIDRRDSFGTVTTLFEQTMTNEELLSKPCDVLIPTSIADQINIQQASVIQAMLIAEVALHALSEEASNMLLEKGTFIIPDVLLNIGPIIVAYAEWRQGENGISAEWVESLVREKVSNTFRRVYDLSSARQITMRLAACMVGLRQLLESMRVRGWIT